MFKNFSPSCAQLPFGQAHEFLIEACYIFDPPHYNDMTALAIKCIGIANFMECALHQLKTT